MRRRVASAPVFLSKKTTMKPKQTSHNTQKRSSAVTRTAPFDGSQTVSTDFFFAFVSALGLGLALLLIGNARDIESQYETISYTAPAPTGDRALQKRVKTLVKGFPIERMATFISDEDETTAAFIVGIAKKESNWGKRVPKKDGKDCFNYWGYRGKSDNVTLDGYTCFDSPKEAVRTIGKRIDTLVGEHSLDTPREMVVWKCGYDCSGHSSASVEKWIKDVGYYYGKVKTETERASL